MCASPMKTAFLKCVERLPQEATEALLELATGGKPQKPKVLPANTDPFNHPDAQRRFRVMTNLEELERALAFPWEKWTVFLHPAQRALVERNYKGPARISGSAGTGKTIVALHRAVALARKHPQSHILLSTFSDALANALQIKLNRLIGNESEIANRIRVCSIRGIASELYAEIFGQPNIVEPEQMRSLLKSAADETPGHRFTESFLLGEWTDIVDAWQLGTWKPIGMYNAWVVKLGLVGRNANGFGLFSTKFAISLSNSTQLPGQACFIG
jgi:UvrD/REP helicase N-terminal domain